MLADLPFPMLDAFWPFRQECRLCNRSAVAFATLFIPCLTLPAGPPLPTGRTYAEGETPCAAHHE